MFKGTLGRLQKTSHYSDKEFSSYIPQVCNHVSKAIPLMEVFLEAFLRAFSVEDIVSGSESNESGKVLP